MKSGVNSPAQDRDLHLTEDLIYAGTGLAPRDFVTKSALFGATFMMPAARENG